MFFKELKSQTHNRPKKRKEKMLKEKEKEKKYSLPIAAFA